MLLFRITIKVGKKSGEKLISAIFNIKSEIFIIIKLYIDK